MEDTGPIVSALVGTKLPVPRLRRGLVDRPGEETRKGVPQSHGAPPRRAAGPRSLSRAGNFDASSVNATEDWVALGYCP
jgi:hypothetical protein